MENVGEPMAVCTLRAHRGEVTCADASGAWLATGGGDGVLQLWHWRPGGGWEEAASKSRAHRYGVTAARWAPTGVLLASAGVDGAALIWAARTLRMRLALVAPHAAAARSLCWATNERLLVGHDDGTVRAWRVHDTMLLTCVRVLQGAVHALTAFGGSTLLLAACTEGVLKIFNLEEVCSSGIEGASGPGPLVWEDGAHDLGALCADGSACGRAAATGGQDARVRVWRAAPGGAVAGGVLSGHGGAVTTVRWARDAALLVSGSLDRTARVWAVATGVCVRVLPAHSRYLTCVVVPQNARYIITGSNDKTVRTWSLSTFSIDEVLEPECSPLVHFGLGDLKGIGPVDDELASNDGDADAGAGGGDTAVTCAWFARDCHGGAVNCVSAHGERLATACSDGAVRVFRWREEDATLTLVKALGGHQYPVLSVDFAANGALLLSAGLDGRACLWDVETGCDIASMWAAGAVRGADSELGGGGAGGGVRCARVSPHRPPLLLLATDAGVAALWSVTGADADPLHVYPEAGGGAACTCVAWSADGAVAAAGGAGGALQLLAPPPAATELHRLPDAHDLGVLCCDFAVESTADEDGRDEEARTYLLASGGMDESVRLWSVAVRGDTRSALVFRGALTAHGGAVHSVRWGARLSLATAGADRWARVWRVTADRHRRSVRAMQVAAVPAGGAGGAPAVAFLRPGLLAVGSLAGRLALWRLPEPVEMVQGPEGQEEIGAEPRWWGQAGVLRWLEDYVTRVPDNALGAAAAAAAAAAERLAAEVRASALTGARLLDEPLDQLLRSFGYGFDEANEGEGDCESGDDSEIAKVAEALRSRLLEELQWLRRAPLPHEVEAHVPHELLCALTHAVPRWPVRASDGYTYELAALLHWQTAAGAVSPVSGRRLRGEPAPNRGVLRALRQCFASAAQ